MQKPRREDVADTIRSWQVPSNSRYQPCSVAGTFRRILFNQYEGIFSYRSGDYEAGSEIIPPAMYFVLRSEAEHSVPANAVASICRTSPV